MELNWYSHCGNRYGWESRNRITLWSNSPVPMCILKSMYCQDTYVRVYDCVAQSSCGQNKASQLRSQDIIHIYVTQCLWDLWTSLESSQQPGCPYRRVFHQRSSNINSTLFKWPGLQEDSDSYLSNAQVSFFHYVHVYILCTYSWVGWRSQTLEASGSQ